MPTSVWKGVKGVRIVTVKNDKKEEGAEMFFVALRMMLFAEIGERMDRVEEKEALYIAEYIRGLTEKAFKMWRAYRRLPIHEWTLWGDATGGSIASCYMTPDMEKVEGWMLKRYTHILTEAKEKWDLELQARDIPKPDMGQIRVDNVAYSALEKHIKDK